VLVVSGIFENEKFIPDKPVSIPQKKRVIVTIEEEQKAENVQGNKWREFGEAILNCDEDLPGWPVPVQFRTPKEIEAL
jgi:hypothetical protein